MKQVVLVIIFCCLTLPTLPAKNTVNVDTTLQNVTDYVIGGVPEGSKIASLKEGGQPASPDDCKNKRFYVGARAGLSFSVAYPRWIFRFWRSWVWRPAIFMVQG